MQEELQKLKEEFDQRIKALEDKYDSKEEFEPKCDDKYWVVGANGKATDFIWTGDSFDVTGMENKAFFRTEEEAQFEAERLKVLRELEKMGKPFEPNEHNLSVCYNYRTRGLDILGYTVTHSVYGDFYFSTQREAEQAVEKIGEDRIKKYLFRVEE